MKLFLSVLIIASFLLSFASSLPSIQLESESYQSGETLIGTIEGITSTISKEDIKFYQERRELMVDKEIYKFQDKYYFYIILPSEGIYRLEIRNLLYEINNTFGKLDIIKNITIQNERDSLNKTQIISIRPGVISTYSNDTTIYVTNIGTKNVSLEYLQNKRNLYPGEIEKISLKLNSSLELINIESYKNFYVPVIAMNIGVIKNETNQTQIKEENNSEIINITSTMKILKIGIIRGKDKQYNFTIINLGKSLDNISLESEKNILELNPAKINYFENNTIKKINFSVKYGEFYSYNDSVIFIYNNSEILRLPVEIYVFENENFSQNYSASLSAQQKSCVEVSGKICASNENCEGDYTYIGGLCCFGTCEKVQTKTSNPANIFTGIIIFLLVAGGAYYFYKRIKNVKKQTPDEKIEELGNKK